MGTEDFPQIKRDLVNKINAIGRHIEDQAVQREEVRVLLGKVSLAVFGDPTARPPIKGHQDRLEKLEKIEEDRIKEETKNKDNAVALAVGSAAIAIGGALIWVAVAIKEAFMKGH